jgi:uncharacterized Zn-binding protein involved in type VI secretion
MTDKSGFSSSEKYIFTQAEQELKAFKPPAPPPHPVEPKPPENLKQEIASGMQSANKTAQAMSAAAGSAASSVSQIAAPGAALAASLGAGADEKASKLVSGLAAAIGPFPAATMLNMALGIPHAHVKHPPSGPPPIPPIPLPPFGPVMLGLSVQVLINNKPSARCGDYGFNPTCAGIAPPLSAMFQIITGSSNVYIGGARAARSGIDITMHCFSMPSPKIPIKIGKMAGIASKVGKAAGKVAGAAAKVAGVSAKVSMATQIATSFADAEAADDAAMSSAIGLSVAMMAAQAAADAAAASMTRMMGTDQPCIPPTGTPGMILDGSPNVLIGGFPLPSFAAIAQGLLKRIKGLKATRGGGGGSPVGCPACGK